MLMGPRNVLVSRQRQLNTLKFPIQEYTNYGLLVHLKPWIGAEDTARRILQESTKYIANEYTSHSLVRFRETCNHHRHYLDHRAYTRLLHSEGTGRGLCTRLVRVFKLYYLTF